MRAGGAATARLSPPFPLADFSALAHFRALGGALPGAFLRAPGEREPRPRRQRRTLGARGPGAPGTCRRRERGPPARRRAAPRRAAAPLPRRPRRSTLPRAGRAAERVGGQAREGKGEEGGREGGRGASPRRGRALARAAGIARRRCGNVRHVGHGAGSGSGGRAADLVLGSGRGRRGAVFGRVGAHAVAGGRAAEEEERAGRAALRKEVEEAAGVLPPSPPAPPPPPGLFL